MEESDEEKTVITAVWGAKMFLVYLEKTLLGISTYSYKVCWTISVDMRKIPSDVSISRRSPTKSCFSETQNLEHNGNGDKPWAFSRSSGALGRGTN